MKISSAIPVGRMDASLPAPELGKGPKAAEAFEAYLIGFLSKQMRNAVPDGPLNAGAAGVFGDLLDQEIGKRAAEGQGIGLRHEIEVALARHEGLAQPDVPSRGAAPSSDWHAMSGQPTGVRPVAPGDALGGLAHITSGFGVRHDPIDGTTRHHDGLDIGLPAGTSVRAERAGRVSFAGERGGYGNVVIVDHGGGLETRYAHCASLDVKAGDLVVKGAVLGTVGSTGRSTGPHLHLEVRQDDVPVDPSTYMEENR